MEQTKMIQRLMNSLSKVADDKNAMQAIAMFAEGVALGKQLQNDANKTGIQTRV